MIGTNSSISRTSAEFAPTYDARGNLTSAGGQADQYSKTNRLYNAPQLVMERTYAGGPGAIARRYVYGADAAPLVWYEGANTSDPRWLHTDERGSVIAVTAQYGNPLTRVAYDDYGNAVATTPANRGRFGYTG